MKIFNQTHSENAPIPMEMPPPEAPRTLAELLTEAAQLAQWLADNRETPEIDAVVKQTLEMRRQQLASLLAQIQQLATASKPEA